MAAHRNRVEDNVIENNGVKEDVLEGNRVEAAKVPEDKRNETR